MVSKVWANLEKELVEEHLIAVAQEGVKPEPFLTFFKIAQKINRIRLALSQEVEFCQKRAVMAMGEVYMAKDPKKIRVLDIGCGSIQQKEIALLDTRLFEPWTCRIFAALGMNVTGVDSEEAQEGREASWSFIKGDIKEAQTWEQLEKQGPWDLVNMESVLAYRDKPGTLSPYLRDQMGDDSAAIQKLEDLVSESIKRLLKPDGIWLRNREVLSRSQF